MISTSLVDWWKDGPINHTLILMLNNFHEWRKNSRNTRDFGKAFELFVNRSLTLKTL